MTKKPLKAKSLPFKEAPWKAGSLPRICFPFVLMARNIAVSLERENPNFKGLTSNSKVSFNELRSLSTDICSEIRDYRRWLESILDEGMEKNEFLHSHYTDTELLLDFIENTDASSNFFEYIRQKYGFNDIYRTLVSARILIELDLLHSLSEKSKQGSSTARDFLENQMGYCLKSMGMLSGILWLGSPKREISKTMSQNAKKKGEWLRKEVIRLYRELSKECDRKKEIAYMIAEKIWENPENRKHLENESYSKCDVIKKTVDLVYNYFSRKKA